MKKTEFTYYLIIIVFGLICVLYYANICGFYERIIQYIGYGLIAILCLLHCFLQHIKGKIFEYLSCSIGLLWVCYPIIKGTFYHYHGLSIIKSAQIEKVYPRKSYHPGWSKVKYRYHDTIRISSVPNLTRLPQGAKCYIIQPLECRFFVFTEYRDTINYPQIHDFAFLDDTTFYTYHDFSLIKPDLVYYQVGYNVLYNAACDTSAIADNTVLLSFTDVLGKGQTVKYSVKGYPSIPDTFLVYRNVNEKLDSKWHVCAPEVNTPENRAKISDYGYIFHYDVYSKQEIESQCPRIRDYVEQYKKRHIKRHTVSSSAS